MIWVVFLCGALWVLGGVFDRPRRERWILLSLVWGLAFFVLRVPGDLSSDDARVWVLVTVIAGLGLGYILVLQRLKRRVTVPDAPKPLFQPAELERYARHIMLREIGGPGQKALKNARVLVIGAGGLGSPSLLYLAAAGVGTIGVVDDDTVDASNLQRQVIHTDLRIGTPKVQSARDAMLALNPFVQVRPYQRRLTAETAAILDDYDLILDGSDNFDTRYLVNQLAVKAGKPLISAAITQWEGQISLYDPAHGTPCYQCIFPHRPAPGMVPTCAEAGVASPLPGVIGSMMAMEAVKHITGAGEGLKGRLMIYDALYAEVRVIRIKRREDCEICG
jgi:molybdopterin/thiamine biosynthesis adenylyltransferase